MTMLDTIYAKSADANNKQKTLTGHLYDVVYQMCEFIRLYQHEINNLSAANDINLTRILLYSAFLHDFGKAHEGFQKQLLPNGERWGYRHEVLSMAFINYLNIPEKEFAYLIAGIGLHHKNLYDIMGGYYYKDDMNTRFEGVESIANLVELAKLSQVNINALVQLLKDNKLMEITAGYGIELEPYSINEAFTLTPSAIPAQIYGHIEVIYTLYRGFITQGGRGKQAAIDTKAIKIGMIVRGLVLSSDHLASAGKDSIGLDGHYPLSTGINSVEEVIAKFGLTNLRPHQAQIKSYQGNAILVAPTGSGKTESSVLWATYQKENSKTNGRTYILLPVRASMNAMDMRLKKVFGDREVNAIHGKSLINAYTRLMDQEYGNNPDKAKEIAKEKESLARMNTTPIRISSPYNIFRPFFGESGYEASLCSAIDANLIFDEIHAYDTKITGFILAAAKYLNKTFGAKALFMSATMPTHLQNILKKEFGIAEIIRPDKGFLESNRRHRVMILPNLINEYIDNIIADARNDKSVLVISNTVDNAIELYDKIKSSVPETILMHSRFTADDRREKENNLKPEPGKILIATQVVEVSLDIDYDTCYTELAPLESLLQRFGRVNRHGKREPAPVNICIGNQDKDKVYNKEHLQKTAEVLTGIDNQVISELMIQELLDDSYPEELIDELKKEIENTIKGFAASFTDTLTPFGPKDKEILNGLRGQWDDLFEGSEIIPASIYKQDIDGKYLNSLDISKYKIPVSLNRFMGERKKGNIDFHNFIPVYNDVADEYSYEYGLRFAKKEKVTEDND